MSEDSSKQATALPAPGRRSWGPLAAVLIVLFSFLIIQQVAGVLLVIIPRLLGWDSIMADEWLVNSPVATFVYVLLAEAMTIGSLLWFLTYKRAPFLQTVGLLRPKWSYLGHAVVGYVAYFLLFVAIIAITRLLLPVDIEQEQALGFQRDSDGPALAMAFISLVILPPIVEEIVFRGFFFGTLRANRAGAVSATIITSILFGALHLFGSADGSLLWIAAIDTFILSVVLCYLRERTGSIWASVGVHAIKNAVVFVNLFIIGTS